MKWYWVVLIVIGALLLIAIVSVIFYAQKNGKPTSIYQGTEMAKNAVAFGVGDITQGYWKTLSNGKVEWYTFN